MNRNRFRSTVIVVCVLSCARLGPAIVQAQRLRSTSQPTKSQTVSKVELNRSAMKAFEQSRAAIANGEFERGLNVLQRRFLDGHERPDTNVVHSPSEDYFVDQKMSLSLKQAALDLIAGLPPEGRRMYEQLFGIVARQMLEAAVDSRDVRALEDVSRRYFHTQAGYEATYRLGTHHLDHTTPLQAALCFQQLVGQSQAVSRWEPMLSLKLALCWLRAGLDERGVDVLLKLKESSQDGDIVLAGENIALFENENEALVWLVEVLGQQPSRPQVVNEEWPVVRGNAARNASNAPAVPVWDSAWRQSTVRQPDHFDAGLHDSLSAFVEQLDNERTTSRSASLPVSQPLVVGQKVIFRSIDRIKAVDLQTGELLWESAIVDPVFESLIGSVDHNVPLGIHSNELNLRLLTSQRLWEDLAYGTLSSNGETVFAIEDVSRSMLPTHQPGFRAIRQNQAQPAFNKLVAHDLATGRVKWEAGGARSQHQLDVAGTHFLGSPLPVGETLYCIVEVSSELQLMALDSKTGQRIWSQSLVLTKIPLSIDSSRRLAGLSPSLQNGILICPTSAGTVVAIDLARRQLLWGYQYDSVANTPYNRFGLPIGISPSGSLHRGRGWADSTAIIKDDAVLITPRDSEKLHCLNLFDGKVRWKKPRGSALYLAAVFDEKAVLIGEAAVEAYRLRDGEPAWKKPAPVTMPSGRGFRSGSLYHLPLSTSEVATIDLSAGRVLARSPSRTGAVSGNMVTAGGVIVTQTVDSISAFRSLDAIKSQVLAKLKASPQDAQALTLRGKMRLHQGDEKGGLADLWAAIEHGAGREAENAIVAALIDGLRFDFAAYRGAADEVRKLIHDSHRHREFLQLYAEGLQSVGDHAEAFDTYLALANSTDRPRAMQDVSPSWGVREDRWIRYRMESTYQNASVSQRNQIDETLAQLIVDVGEQDDIRRTRWMTSCLDRFPFAQHARKRLVELLDPAEHALELEHYLRRLHDSSDTQTAATATARLVRLLRVRRHHERTHGLIEELQEKWGKVVCLDGKTGNELATTWLAEELIPRRLSSASEWPPTQFEARFTERTVQNPSSVFPLRVDGPRGPVFEYWSFELNGDQSSLIARDGSGVERWKLAIPRSPGAPEGFFNGYVRVHGHVLMLALPDKMFVIDTLTDNGGPHILWSRELIDPAALASMSRDQFRTNVVLPGGGQQFRTYPRSRSAYGTAGFIADSYVCYQIGSVLTAADLITGETLWEQHGIQSRSYAFGDDEYLLVVSRNAKTATVLRAGDGKLIERRPFPVGSTRILTFGRNILTRHRPRDEAGNTSNVLTGTDVVTGEILWEQEFPNGSQFAIVKGDEFAVWEPSGRFTIIAIDDGESRLEAAVQPTKTLEGFTVLRSQDQYLVFSNDPNRRQRVRHGVSATMRKVRVGGNAYGFDRASGRKLWTTRLEKQELSLSQPANLPLLTFTTRTRIVAGSAGRRVHQRFVLAALDVRNGRVVYWREQHESLGTFRTDIDADQQTIILNFDHAMIEFTPTKVPLSEPLETQEERSDAGAPNEAPASKPGPTRKPSSDDKP